MLITLVLADEQPIVLHGLNQVFALEQDFRVLASCATGEDALAAVRGQRPAILVLDLRLPAKDGLTALREMHAEGLPTRVVVFTAAIEEGQLVEAIDLGARGVVLKELAPKFLVQCIRKVHRGGEWFETRSIGRLVGEIRRRNGELTRGNGLLTPREIEIVRMVAEGLSNQGIGKRLFIHEATVKGHVHHIYEKLKVTNRVALLRYAQAKGWV